MNSVHNLLKTILYGRTPSDSLQENLMNHESLEEFCIRNSINLNEVYTILRSVSELKGNSSNPIPVPLDWIVKLRPSEIHTKIRKPKRNVILFSNITSYVNKNIVIESEYFKDERLPTEKKTFSECILKPVYEKHKQLNIMYIVTAAFYQYSDGHYYADSNNHGWDPASMSKLQRDTAANESRFKLLQNITNFWNTYKSLFSLDGHECNVFTCHLSSGEDWENPDQSEVADNVQPLFYDLQLTKNKDMITSDMEKELTIFAPGFKDENYWDEFMRKHQIQLLVFEGGQTHWLNRQIRDHGLMDYLTSDLSLDIITSGSSAGIINQGVTTSFASFKCHYNETSYGGCDFVKVGKPRNESNAFCVSNDGPSVGIESGSHVVYTNQKNVLENCLQDAIGRYEGIIFPHVPNSNDSELQILRELYPNDGSSYTFGVKADYNVVRFDDGTPYFGEVLLMTDGECGACGPLFSKGEYHSHFVRLPFDRDIDTLEKNSIMYQQKKSKSLPFYKKCRQIRAIDSYMEENVVYIVKLIKDVKSKLIELKNKTDVSKSAVLFMKVKNESDYEMLSNIKSKIALITGVNVDQLDLISISVSNTEIVLKLILRHITKTEQFVSILSTLTKNELSSRLKYTILKKKVIYVKSKQRISDDQNIHKLQISCMVNGMRNSSNSRIIFRKVVAKELKVDLRDVELEIVQMKEKMLFATLHIHVVSTSRMLEVKTALETLFNSNVTQLMQEAFGLDEFSILVISSDPMINVTNVISNLNALQEEEAEEEAEQDLSELDKY